MFAEMSSLLTAKTADIFVNLSKNKRVKRAVYKYSKENRLLIIKAVEIY
jgi:hypothetical protein